MPSPGFDELHRSLIALDAVKTRERNRRYVPKPGNSTPPQTRAREAALERSRDQGYGLEF